MTLLAQRGGVSRNHYRARDVAKIVPWNATGGEAIMAELNAGAVQRARWYEGLGLTFLAGVVCGGLAVALWSGGRSDNPTPVAVAGSAIQQARARPAAPVLAADHQGLNGPASDGQRRRLLLLLMMNGAGSLGPYGKIGR